MLKKDVQVGYARSDLACESCQKHEAIDGTEQSERRVGEITVTQFKIVTEQASQRLGKPCGSYVTFESGRIDRLYDDRVTLFAHLLAGELRGMAERLTQKKVDSSFGVFVAGLGNAELTADAVGPRTVARLTATRHLREHEGELFFSSGCSSLSALSPGVLGQTGIETAELLAGAVRVIAPDLVIAVDALAARSCDRLASTVQISDVGILPGAGVGNHRAAIDRQTLGIPVIALGVPTVVDSATLVFDALREAGIEEISPELIRVLETGKSFFVSPKESDMITDRVSRLLSRALTLAFGGELAEELGE